MITACLHCIRSTTNNLQSRVSPQFATIHPVHPWSSSIGTPTASKHEPFSRLRLGPKEKKMENKDQSQTHRNRDRGNEWTRSARNGIHTQTVARRPRSPFHAPNPTDVPEQPDSSCGLYFLREITTAYYCNNIAIIAPVGERDRPPMTPSSRGNLVIFSSPSALGQLHHAQSGAETLPPVHEPSSDQRTMPKTLNIVTLSGPLGSWADDGDDW